VNTRTGRRTSIGFGKPDSGNGEAWVVDKNGVARVQTVFDAGKVRHYYRAGPDAPWVKLDEFKQVGANWYPLAVTDDDKALLVSDRRNRDKAAIVRYDPATKTFGEVIAAHPQVDLNELARRQGEVYGVQYDADRHGVAWFDEEIAKIQNMVDKALPDTVNLLTWSRDPLALPDQFVLRRLARLLLPARHEYEEARVAGGPLSADQAEGNGAHEAGALQGPRRPRDPGVPDRPERQRRQEPADGRERPRRPVGRWRRMALHAEVQYLAARGYAVLQPNYRGTTRYGWKHFSSSFGQWGLAMQDDVTDGVKWAIEQGIADPKRICIYGGSYGGYATMMGLAKDPDLYRCGINYVGVTDIDLYLTASWSDYASSDFLKYTVQEMVGDSKRDAERIKATSPVEQAAASRRRC
jgi:hypothetical protein